MICLRCGYCCINYPVTIIDNPILPLSEENLIFHYGGKPCKHLQGTTGNYNCVVHNHPDYKKTPCFQHSQVESKNSNCRIGQNILKNLDK